MSLFWLNGISRIEISTFENSLIFSSGRKTSATAVVLNCAEEKHKLGGEQTNDSDFVAKPSRLLHHIVLHKFEAHCNQCHTKEKIQSADYQFFLRTLTEALARYNVSKSNGAAKDPQFFFFLEKVMLILLPIRFLPEGNERGLIMYEN